MKSISLIAALTVFLTACTSASSIAKSDPPSNTCALASTDRAVLETWRETKFEDQHSDQAAIDFASCLGSPDPFLRDKIGYEGLTAALRSGSVSEATRLTLISEMLLNLNDTKEPGVVAPFSALALSELVRTDRIEAFLSTETRADISLKTADYIAAVTDYRAFSETEGWRHGVAHGADVAMQLALNPNTDDASLRPLRDAVASQIAGRSGYAFRHGEPQRLARPIYFMATRGAFDAADWAEWFAPLSDPAPLSAWGEAYQSETDLARLHNLKAFARVLYINASLSENESLKPIAEEALKMLQKLP